jgi:hypothetical protein
VAWEIRQQEHHQDRDCGQPAGGERVREVHPRCILAPEAA